MRQTCRLGFVFPHARRAARRSRTVKGNARCYTPADTTSVRRTGWWKMKTVTSIGVGRDRMGWHERVLESLDARAAAGCPIHAVPVDIDAHDWLTSTLGLDVLIWNPRVLGAVSSSFFKEKVLFLEMYRGVRVMPNLRTAWHFESKVAQSYLLEQLEIPRPRTVVSFEYNDAVGAAKSLGFPLVAKKSHGASSKYVRLVESEKELLNYLQREFAQQLWDERKSAKESAAGAAVSALSAPWFRQKVADTILDRERHGYAYFQEFIPDNDADLRVVVIGRWALGCWRANRKNDFRASGGGKNLWNRPVPEDAIRLCFETSRRIGADSLAFDVLRREGQPVIVEISYAFPPENAYEADGHWVEQDDGQLTWVEGHIWPQELWVTRLMEELGL